MSTETLTYDAFLKQHQNNQAKMKELRKQHSFSKPSPFVLRMKNLRLSDIPVWTKLIPKAPANPYHTFFQSWSKVQGKNRPVLCNCRSGELTVPCLPCYKVAQTENPKLIPGRREAITAIRLEYFHKVTKTNQSDKEYTVFESCAGTDIRGRSVCTHCDQELDKYYGDKYYWPLGYNHKLQLEKQLTEIESKCANCKEGIITPYAYTCEKCDEVIIDVHLHEISAEDENILRAATDIDCPHCEHVGPVKELVECLKTEGYGSAMEVSRGCDNPTAIENIWDLDFAIKTVGEKGQSTIVIKDWRVGSTENLKDFLLEPMDFNYFLTYMDLEEQAKAMGCDNPFSDELQEFLQEFYTKRFKDAKAKNDVEEY